MNDWREEVCSRLLVERTDTKIKIVVWNIYVLVLVCMKLLCSYIIEDVT